MVEHVGATRASAAGADAHKPSMYVVDAVLGATGRALGVAGAMTRPITSLVAPVTRLALRPPWVPVSAQPGTWVDAAAAHGAVLRGAAAQRLAARIDAALPVVAATLDGHADLTEIVKGRVDLVAVATDLVTEMDLPQIIISTTGAATSETVAAVRMHSMSADDALGRAMGRVRQRMLRRPRPSQAGA